VERLKNSVAQEGIAANEEVASTLSAEADNPRKTLST
jgi:hypothetical protein